MDNHKKIMGLRIKFLRTEKDLTQQELANKLRVGRTAIANYEIGKMSPRDNVKIEMCKIFGCTMDFLMAMDKLREVDYED